MFFKTFSDKCNESAYMRRVSGSETCDSIESVNITEEKYLRLSLEKLEKHLPAGAGEMFRHYLSGEYASACEVLGENMQACIFSYPVLDGLEQIILLVYDTQDRIIADTAGYHMPVRQLLGSKEIYDLLSDESEWLYLEHYIICSYMFEELPYPFCQSGAVPGQGYDGEALLYSNAYVTKCFRRQGIFRAMTEMMREFVLRNSSGRADLYSVISLDPDIACYGPDTQEWPYIYSYERDEPDRQRNVVIMEHLGYEALRLQEDDPEAETDGTKLWFAVRHERDMIIEAAAV